MDWSNNYVNLPGYLDKFIEETVGSGTAYYRPAHLAPNRWAYQIDNHDPKRKPKPSYFICVKLAGPTVLRIRLPRWVSVRVVFS